MDPISLEGEADPGRADGVVRTRGQNEFVGDSFFQSDINENLGVKRIVRVGSGADNGEVLVGDFVFIRGNGARETSDHLIVGVVGQEGGLREHDHDASNRR